MAAADGYYLTDRHIISFPYMAAIIQLLNVTPKSSLHSFLVHCAKDVLETGYNLEGFTDYPSPSLKILTPNVRVSLKESVHSKKHAFLSIKLEFIYGQQARSLNHCVPVMLINGEYIGRNIDYELKAAEKLYGKNKRFEGVLPQSLALDFLFEKLPKLPSHWEIVKELDYFNFEEDHDYGIDLHPSKGEEKDWFDITFKMPAKLRKSFSKRLIQDILRKKPKYINTYGKWVQCSEKLLRSISMAYFIGPQVFGEGADKISAFQVIGMWHYLQQDEKLPVPPKISQTIDKLKSFSGITMPPFHDKLDKTLRPYQKEGVAWLNFLHDHNLSGILCDDMGLGKTLQTLAFLWHLKQQGKLKQCVIVAPTSAVSSWQIEIEKFLPDFSVAVLEGLDRKKNYSRWKEFDLFLVSYTIFSKDMEEFSGKKINYLILDEAQFIKNAGTKRARALFAVKSERRLALTGTPLENRLSDLWSIFHFLMPGYLGSLEYFRDTYQNPIEKKNEIGPLKVLRERIKPFLLRRLKEKVEKDLPPKTEVPVFCELTEDQKKVYLHTLSLVRQEVFDTIKEKGMQNSYIHIFAALTKLRQICNHPALIFDKPDPHLTSGKFEAFKEYLTEAVSEKHSLLVFSQFTSMLAYIRQWLEEEKIPYLYLDGATKDRGELVKKFEAGEHPVFLISLKAGGTALTLTRADYVMHFDPWWNPAVENQATDRAHRIGQTKHVFVYKFYCRGTIEEKILHLQQKKQKMFNDIMDGSLNKPLQLTQSDLEEILTPNF